MSRIVFRIYSTNIYIESHCFCVQGPKSWQKKVGHCSRTSFQRNNKMLVKMEQWSKNRTKNTLPSKQKQPQQWDINQHTKDSALEMDSHSEVFYSIREFLKLLIQLFNLPPFTNHFRIYWCRYTTQDRLNINPDLLEIDPLSCFMHDFSSIIINIVPFALKNIPVW